MKYITYILIFFTIIGFIACTDFDEENTEQTDTEEYPDQESWNARMYFTKDGKRRAILESGYIAKYSKKQITFLKEGMQVDFLTAKGTINLH